MVCICRFVPASTLHTGNNPTVMYSVSSLLCSSLYCDLWTGCMLGIGQSRYFRFIHPVEALRLKKNLSSNYHEVPKMCQVNSACWAGDVVIDGFAYILKINCLIFTRQHTVGGLPYSPLLLAIFSCGYLSAARCSLFAYGPADATAIPAPSLASFKSRLVFPFWYRLNQVVLEKRPLTGCSIVVLVVWYSLYSFKVRRCPSFTQPWLTAVFFSPKSFPLPSFSFLLYFPHPLYLPVFSPILF